MMADDKKSTLVLYRLESAKENPLRVQFCKLNPKICNRNYVVQVANLNPPKVQSAKRFIDEIEKVIKKVD